MAKKPIIVLKEENECPFGLCNGSGIVDMGEDDEEIIKDCLCVIERRADEVEND